METLIESIRVAVLDEATDEQKQQGAVACRTIAAALEAKSGEPIVATATAPPPLLPDVAALVNVARAMGPDQLLDTVIARLRAAVPEASTVCSLQPVRFTLVPVPPVAR